MGKIRGTDDVPLESTFSEISKVPYAEAPHWRGLYSPYYNETHDVFRRELRKWLAENMREEAEHGEENNIGPSAELVKKFGDVGLFAAALGPGPHLNLVQRAPWVPDAETYDYFHEIIFHEEIGRLMCPGFEEGLLAGMGISVPALLAFGNERMKREIAPSILRGEKRSCLAITEPFAGSDVANVRCRAERSADGTHFIVNGVKKWITNAVYSDYFVTLVRTGGKGAGGLTMLLIERGEGIDTKIIKTSYSSSAGTSYITLENVKVPVANILSKESNGFMVTMANFNHERFMICSGMLGKARVAVEECFKWATQRKVFGKALINQPVIQEKLAKMAARVEAGYAWMETLTNQMNHMNYEEQNKKLGGEIALLKYEAANIAHVVAAEAVQIFGGRGLTKSGMGRIIERFQRTYKIPGVYGGSSEIMASLGIRQALKTYPRNAKL